MTHRHRKIFAVLSALAPAALTLAALCPNAHAAEHITLRNGFELDCARRETTSDNHVRLYLLATTPATTQDQRAVDEANYIEVSASA